MKIVVLHQSAPKVLGRPLIVSDRKWLIALAKGVVFSKLEIVSYLGMGKPISGKADFKA